MPRTVSFTQHDETVPSTQLYSSIQSHTPDSKDAAGIQNYIEAACCVGWSMRDALLYAEQHKGLEDVASCIRSLMAEGYELGESHYVAKST